MATYEKRNAQFGWVITGTYTSIGEQETIDLPYEPNGYAVQLDTVGGSAKIQASLNGVGWIDWNDGNITGSQASYMVPMRFIRVVTNTSTSATITIWGQR